MPRIIFAVPPVKSDKGFAQATQNRQYQYFRDPTFIYPIIPAIFTTMILTEPGNEVLWVDSVAEGLNDVEFGKLILEMRPDFIVFEANTMVITQYYEFIDGIKKNTPVKDMEGRILWAPKIILCGEHVTALPDEVKEKCKADYFIQGGKWYNDAFKIITGKDWPKDKLLPHINRDASRWWLYAYKNGNYKYLPATYTMASQDCWYRPKQACTFCSWVNYHPENVTRPVEDFLQEIKGLINFGFKEFFDDSGTFPVGKWLDEFCHEMIDRGYNKYIKWGCNMRFKALQPADFKLMAKAGCRFILWGFESANQGTLDKLSKGYAVKEVSPNLIAARMAGIWNHLTVMNGYPWETLEEEKNTFKMVKWLLVNDWAASMQSTIFMPYPGTRAFEECKGQGLILTEDWSKWDMTHQVIKLKYSFEDALKLQKEYYNISYHPRFIFNRLKNIRSGEDLKQYFRLGKKVINRFAGVHAAGVAID